MSYKDKNAARAYARAWYARNAKKENERSKKYREANKEKVREVMRLWRESNRDYPKQWNKNNRDKLRAADKRWTASHPEEVRIKARKRRARKKAVGGNHTKADIQKINNSQKSRYAYCKVNLTNKNTHVDHIIPLNLGGHNGPQNLQLLCASCNLKKNRKHPLDYAREIGMLI